MFTYKRVNWRNNPVARSTLLDDGLALFVFKGKLATCGAIDYADTYRLRYPLTVYWHDTKGTIRAYTIREDDTAKRSRTGARFQRDSALALARDRL